MKDKSISIYEVEVPNSGILEGRFLERMKVPYSSPTPAEGPKYINEQDLYIGAHLRIFGRVFHLLTADAFTMQYMEENKCRFPVADPDMVLQKVRCRKFKYRAGLWQARFPFAIAKLELLLILRSHPLIACDC